MTLKTVYDKVFIKANLGTEFPHESGALVKVSFFCWCYWWCFYFILLLYSPVSQRSDQQLYENHQPINLLLTPEKSSQFCTRNWLLLSFPRSLR